MVSRRTPLLTGIGFRRGVKWFIAGVVGFLVFLVLVLLLLLQRALEAGGEAETRARAATATAVVDAVDAIEADPSSSVFRTRLDLVRERYGLSSLTLDDGVSAVTTGRAGSDDAEIRRTSSRGSVILGFDRETSDGPRRTILAAAVIVIGSTLAATLLLVVFLPRVTRPVELMLEEASTLRERARGMTEEHYLLETFRSSIATLREQEEELKRLHEYEKTRADELQRVTATLTRSLTSGFISIDSEGRVVDLNRSARQILGIDDERWMERPLAEAIADGQLRSLLEEHHAGRTIASRHEIELQSGTPIGITTVPLTGERQQYLGMIALFADLTDVRRLESRVRELQALADLGEMSAGIAHEFRNSLATILGYLRMLRKEPLGESAMNRVASAESEARDLGAAVDGLLQFARPMTLEREPLDLRDAVAEVLERMSVHLEDVEVEQHLEPVFVLADPPLLRRVIENVVKNAADAIAQKGGRGRITIRSAPAGNSALLVVIDDGVGLDPSDAGRCFLPFHSNKPDGLGLGLALTRKIVLLHEGTISLDGKPGEGAVVTIALPADLHRDEGG